MNPDLVATFIDRIVEVTSALLGAEDLEAAKQQLIEAAIAGTDLEGSVVAFDFGNSHYLITTRTYRDVRLVGAPPSAVGKFGGDTDNWVWPRHTGDFSMFRIYANADNDPADYDESNVPYQPAHHFPVNIGGVEDGDFMMVFGFPGTTEQYLTRDAVDHVVSRLNPMRIAMRDASLKVINAARSAVSGHENCLCGQAKLGSQCLEKMDRPEQRIVGVGCLGQKSGTGSGIQSASARSGSYRMGQFVRGHRRAKRSLIFR